MKIIFHADSDLEMYNEAVREYQQIWNSESEKIIESWQRHTGLTFRETFINAVVFDGKSQSHPLSLRHNVDLDRKKALLVHELGHRLLYQRRKSKGDSLERHKFLFLVLYDVFCDLYGASFVRKVINFDNQLGELYKDAWEWALRFNKEERKKKFQEMLNS